MEILVVTAWLYALVVISCALAAALLIRAVRADNRDVAKYEAPPFEPDASVRTENQFTASGVNA